MSRVSQTAIPCTLMRGGTSKGPFFLATDLPADAAVRDRVLLAVMGSPDPRQIDGVGGAEPLTSKVAIVSKSSRPEVDVDYLFAQVSIEKPLVDVSPNCGNMLAGVGPFAIEKGLVPARDPVTPVTIYMVNTGNLAVARIQTPGGVVRYDGTTQIAGVPGAAAPIEIDFLDTAGSVCEALLPSGKPRDRVEGIEVTCIDNGMPVVVLPAAALGKTGYESPQELDGDADFKRRLEKVRLAAGSLMGLGDVRDKVVPKMTLIAPPRAGGHVCTRTFIPHRCHAAIGVLGAVSVATACVLPGSVAAGIAKPPAGRPLIFSVEHPSGEFTVTLEVSGEGANFTVGRSGILRTARALFEGHALVPATIWGGR
ncbi:MAG TPA: 4-oxalomesaconate tautomerase [Steroidobacteraceae bacterium]|nr:4-oxalomesaconate tautomerase [Steroidobacteraceae bacterium]